MLESIQTWFEGVKADFVLNFIAKNRWQMYLEGLGNTLLIAFFACLIGILLGVVVAIVRTSWDTNTSMRPNSFGKSVLRVVNGFCKLYVTVIRGTPMVIQLMIMYYIIMSRSRDGVLVAIISFGINSGAYVSEIFRSGIMSVDKGQMEAGRSLGLSYVQTMLHIISPQVLKIVLPTLANEFITLLKETSVAGYVAVMDLTFAGNRVRGVTFSPFMPLVGVALIYLVLVILLTKLVGLLERRLRQSDNR